MKGVQKQLSPATIIIVLLLFALNLGLLSWAITDLMPRKRVKYLPKAGWIVIIGALPFGSVIYLLAGRGEDS